MNWMTRDVAQVWHEWFNSEKDHDTTKYSFKEMLLELARLPLLFKAHREGKLPKVHQQCSVSAPVAIKNDKLTCCLGKNVDECPILKSLDGYFAQRRKFYTSITEDEMDGVRAATCCQHILRESEMGRKHTFDTSEGYVLTESDRMYWDNVYRNLAGPEPDPLTGGHECPSDLLCTNCENYFCHECAPGNECLNCKSGLRKVE